MNISITYSPSTLQDFLSALEAVQGFKAKAVTVKNPSGEADPVALYMARIGAGRYRRTPESCAANLSNLEDLKKRAASGYEIAMEFRTCDCSRGSESKRDRCERPPEIEFSFLNRRIGFDGR